MKRKTIVRIILCGIACLVFLAIYSYRREGFAEVAPATYLAWSGVQWDICDNAYRVGTEPLPGGVVIASNVVAIQVIGKDHILAKDNSGKWFLIKVEEWGPDDVQTFSVEKEWLEAVKAAGIASPTLRDPAEFYK